MQDCSDARAAEGSTSTNAVSSLRLIATASSREKMDNNKAKIRAFLSQHFGNYELGDQEDIFTSGFVQSLFAMQIILFLETQFDLTVESEDLELRNFRTIDAMDSFVVRKVSATQRI